MSTKATIKHGSDFHLYKELFDGNIYLQLNDPAVCEIESFRDDPSNYLVVTVSLSRDQAEKLGLI